LANVLGLDLIHLDGHFWQEGWLPTPRTQWREVVASLVQRESWVMDGTYESTLDLRIPAMDAAIVIDRPRWGCLWRVLKRRLTIDDRNRPDAPAGQKLDRAFLRYIWQYPSVSQPLVFDGIEQLGSNKPLVVLHSAREMANFIQGMQQTIPSQHG
jgi:adenylate kinase family enzyme